MKFDIRVFANLFKQNPLEAFQYRKNCNGDEIPEEYRKNLETEGENDLKKWDESDSKEENDKEYSREDLIAILEENNINYVKTSKTETLLKKCIENNLI